MSMRVAVIGCGAAGLNAMKHLTSRPALFQAVGFEQQHSTGGTWAYTDQTGTNKYGFPVQSSMYKSLRTNLPKEVMAFPGFSFNRDLPSFVRHQDVLQYLEDYCDHFDLRRHIKVPDKPGCTATGNGEKHGHLDLERKFETLVHSVVPQTEAPSSRDTKFRVSYGPLDDLTNTENQLFDAVIVCNGHNSIPLMPNLKGLDEFKGHVIHSHDYRVPDLFEDKKVLCLGAGASGQDISLDIASVAEKVIISHNKPLLETPLPDNVVQKPGVDYVTEDSVVYKNGHKERVDSLLLCTGYKYNFSFLQGQCAVDIEEERVTPLYKHIVHTKFPNLSIIGLCKILLPFPQFDNQAQYVISYLDGTQKLPSMEEMEKDIERDYRKRLGEGLPKRHAHLMGPRQWEYSDELARLGKFEPLPMSVRNLFNSIHETRVKDLLNYKRIQYNIIDKNHYEKIYPDRANEKVAIGAKS